MTRTRRHRLLALVVTAAVMVSGVVACGSADGSADGPDGDDGATPPAADARRHPDLAGVDSFALALGVDLDRAEAERLGAYDLVAVDGTADPTAVAHLQDQGTIVLGYLSVGTVEPYRSWFAEARDAGWLLERWEDWDEWYADVARPGLRALLVDQARAILDEGFDGLFLDNTDMVAAHPDQADGMVALVGQLDDAVGDGLLFAQNGDDTVDTIADHLDGWNREDVSSTYDFDTASYREVAADDHTDALATLRRLRSEGILATATDYTASARGDDAGRAVRAACEAGALPFVADIDLRRIPRRPVTCA